MGTSTGKMFSKTFALTAVAAFATQTAAFTMPDCWSSCFAKHNVTGQEGLCRNSVVNNCIGYTCHATNATAAAVYTTSAPLYTATPVAPVSAAPVPYSNSSSASLTPSYTKPALSTGASTSAKSASSSTGSTVPFTGGAGSTAASLVLVAGGLAAHLLL